GKAGARERLGDLGVLVLQDAPQDEMATRGDEAAIPLSQGEGGVGEQVGQDEREGRLVLEGLGAREEKSEAIGAVAHRGIPTLGALPGRTHPEPAPDRAGGKRLLPGAGPRFFDEGRDLDLARRRREAQGPELGRIGGHARHQSRRGGAVGEERADARRLRRSLFLDDAERALLPEEIREAFGGVGRGGDGQLPEAHGGGTATSYGASTAEELLHTLEEGGKQRARGLLRGLPKLLEKLTLARAQSRRHLDHD